MVRRPSGGQTVTELLRLGIVLVLTAAGYQLGTVVDDALSLADAETTRLLTSVLGALSGYLLGGFVGRAVVRGVETATSRLEVVPAAQLVAAGLGAALGALLGLVLLAPALVLPLQVVTVPIALLVALVFAYAGARLGAARGGELGRFVGVRGRLEVHTPSRGGGVKALDSSALIDARIVEVARVGFLEGTVVVPTFVLAELQSLADAGDERRRKLGERGLDAVRTLQDESLVAVEIDDGEDDGEQAGSGRLDVAAGSGRLDVDAELAALCRRRRCALVTTDANLARVAEISGVRVLNLHTLADAVRPPVVPGDRVALRVLKAGREPGQGVGYLADGTMVVIEDAVGEVGSELEVDVTSIVQHRQGRMLFAVPARSVTT